MNTFKNYFFCLTESNRSGVQFDLELQANDRAKGEERKSTEMLEMFPV